MEGKASKCDPNLFMLIAPIHLAERPSAELSACLAALKKIHLGIQPQQLEVVAHNIGQASESCTHINNKKTLIARHTCINWRGLSTSITQLSKSARENRINVCIA